MAFISLNVMLGVTASALTMASRVFSWMTRSRSTADFWVDATAGARRSPGGVLFTAPVLATVPPCDNESEHDVQPAEANAEECIGDGKRRRDGSHAEEHEPNPHHRNGGDGERPAADEGRAVAEQPDARHPVIETKAIERHGQ